MVFGMSDVHLAGVAQVIDGQSDLVARKYQYLC